MARPRKSNKNVVETPSILDVGGIEDHNKFDLVRINELNATYTQDKGMKVIHSYITDKGDFASELEALLPHFTSFNIRQFYVPLSLYGVNCDSKYILPVLTQIAKTAHYNTKVSPKEEPAKKPIIKREKEIIDGAKASFEGLVDEILMGNEVTQAQINSTISAEDNKNLISYVDERLNTLEVEYESFNEYFDNLPKRKYNKIVKLGNDIIDTAKKIKDQAKKKAPKRKVKPQNALKAVEKFKYLVEDFIVTDNLSFKSLHPVKLQGAKYALLYDTLQRKLLRIYSEPGTTFTIKGTTIHNMDMEKSTRKAIRSPEKSLPLFNGDKKKIDASFESINSKALPIPTGRSNDNMIIMFVG